jgi:transketolase
MLLYSLLHLTGYADMTLDQVKNFRQLGRDHRGPPGIRPCQGDRDHDRPAGPGDRQRGRHRHGRGDAARALRAQAIVDHRTYVIAGDGCLMEGVSQEAITRWRGGRSCRN